MSNFLCDKAYFAVPKWRVLQNQMVKSNRCFAVFAHINPDRGG